MSQSRPLDNGLLIESVDSARLSLVPGSMARPGGMVPVMMLAVLMLYPPSASSPSRTRPDIQLPASPGVGEPPTPSVRVEHELVRLPRQLVRLPRSRLPEVSRPRPWRSTRLSMTEEAETRRPLIVRARRVVVGARRAVIGDGRYRPEPFPRLER